MAIRGQQGEGKVSAEQTQNRPESGKWENTNRIGARQQGETPDRAVGSLGHLAGVSDRRLQIVTSTKE